jgi:Tfp pilus assembly pilus retraction ATPase PilT
MRAIIAQHLLVCDGANSRHDVDADGHIRRSRVVTSEVLMCNPAVANLIATGKSNQIYSAMEAGGHLGMQTFEEDLARLWASGTVSEGTASAMARNAGVLRDRYQALRGNGAISNRRGALR